MYNWVWVPVQLSLSTSTIEFKYQYNWVWVPVWLSLSTNIIESFLLLSSVLLKSEIYFTQVRMQCIGRNTRHGWIWSCSFQLSYKDVCEGAERTKFTCRTWSDSRSRWQFRLWQEHQCTVTWTTLQCSWWWSGKYQFKTLTTVLAPFYLVDLFCHNIHVLDRFIYFNKYIPSSYFFIWQIYSYYSFFMNQSLLIVCDRVVNWKHVCALFYYLRCFKHHFS